MRNRRGLLQLEGLTERIVPAVSIRAVDGDLLISGIANTNGGLQKLWVNVTGDNQVSIYDGGTGFGTGGGKDRGTYSVTGDLIFNLSNRKDSVVVAFQSDFTLDGSVTANLYNGDDFFRIVHASDGGDDAQILGSVTVDCGNGNDEVVIDNDNGGGDGFIIQGGVSVNGGAGKDRVALNDTTSDPLTIGSGVTLTRVNTVDIATNADNVSISGNVIINASADKLIANTINMGTGVTAALTIAGALAITGGQGNDTVNISDTSVVDVVPAQDDVLEISINLDRGTNNTTLTSVQFGTNGTDADMNYTGGTGTDNVTFASTNAVSGDAVFVLGNGTNSLEVSNGTTFDANVTITGGKAGDVIDFNNSIVSGLLSATLGNGTNSLTSGGTIAGGLTYSGGSNDDTVTLSNGDGLAGDVSISTGAGIDSVTISNATAVAVTSLTVDLGIDSAGDTLTYDSVFDALITILNQGSGDTVTSVP